MNRKISALCLSLSLCLAALFDGTDSTYSCAWWFNSETYRISYVDPDLLSDSVYQSFYRTILQEHQAAVGEIPPAEFAGWEWTEIKTRENIEDWKRYFDGQVSAQSLHDLIYKADASVVAPLLALMEMKLPTSSQTVDHIVTDPYGDLDTLETGEVLKAVVRRNDTPFLHYLLYAQESARYAQDPDPWVEDESRPDTSAKLNAIRRGLALHNACRSPFLKLRYAYQIVRTARYAGRYGQAMEYYDRLVAPNPTRSPIRTWALGHKAGAARLAGYHSLSNYWFSQVFDSCEGEREIAVRCFKVRSNEEWDSLYGLARTDHERATLWMLRGFKEPRLTFDYIREMRRLEPGSPRLAAALMRELHRIESHLYDGLETREWGAKHRGGFIERKYEGDSVFDVTTNLESSYWGGEIAHDRRIARRGSWDTLVIFNEHRIKGSHETIRDTIEILSGADYVSSFRRFVMGVAQEGKVMEPALWYMVAGYIDLMDQDFSVADECLDEAERSAGYDDLRRQIVLLDFMRRVKSRGRIDQALENRIYPTLHWFQLKQRVNGHSKYDKVMIAIGQQYLVQNDVPRAILAFARAGDWTTTEYLLDVYADHDDLERFERMMTDGGATEYGRMLVGSLSVPMEGIIDLRATRLMREGRFQEAYELLKRIPAEYRQRPDVRSYRYWFEEENPWGEFRPMRFSADPLPFRSSMDTTLIRGAFLALHDSTDFAELRAVEFDRKTFVEQALRLEELARRHPAQADSAWFRLGNLLFNTWAWSAADITSGWDGFVSRYDDPVTMYPFNIRGVAERTERIDRHRKKELKPRILARKYYERAMKGTKNRELAAHCAFMIDQCNKHPWSWSVDHMEVIRTQDRTGYNLLITKYRDTRFSEWILSQCSVYKYFEKKRLGKE